MDGKCRLGVMGSLTLPGPELVRERLLAVKMVFVAAPGHPLAKITGRVSDYELSRHVQLVLTDRTELSKGQEFQVKSPRNWRLADLGAKHAFLRAGLGWGGMPHAMVARDLQEGTLVEIVPEDDPPEGFFMPMSAAYRADSPPGPAGRWLVETFRRLGGDCPG
jgi:DNA-binding transcriptional LysR family regulator